MYGIVLKLDGEIWLSEFADENTLEDARPISDEKGIYNDLTENEFSFCSFTTPQQDVVLIQDLQRITITHSKFPNHSLKDFIAEGFLPELALDIYHDWMDNDRSNGLHK